MNKKEIADFLEQSFDDKRLSRNESSVFKQLLDEHQLNDNDLAWVRHQIFSIAEQHTKHPHDKDVLKWVKALVSAMANPAQAQREVEHKVLFFPSEHSMKQLNESLSRARQSLDICVFTITNNMISNVIEDLHERGIKVRIMTDDDKSLDRGSDIYRLRDAGIEVRFDNSPHHMHHKFAIVDGQWLINGSFNWTRSATYNNHENIQMTNEPGVVRAFSNEFDRLWKEFSQQS